MLKLPNLADHPADDDEPVAEAWLRSLHELQDRGVVVVSALLPPFDLGAIVELRVERSPADGWMAVLLQGTPGEPTARDDHVVLTRGHLRRLCAALGRPLSR